MDPQALVLVVFTSRTAAGEILAMCQHYEVEQWDSNIIWVLSSLTNKTLRSNRPVNDDSGCSFTVITMLIYVRHQKIVHKLLRGYRPIRDQRTLSIPTTQLWYATTWRCKPVVLTCVIAAPYIISQNLSKLQSCSSHGVDHQALSAPSPAYSLPHRASPLPWPSHCQWPSV